MNAAWKRRSGDLVCGRILDRGRGSTRTAVTPMGLVRTAQKKVGAQITKSQSLALADSTRFADASTVKFQRLGLTTVSLGHSETPKTVLYSTPRAGRNSRRATVGTSLACLPGPNRCTLIPGDGPAM